MVSHQLNGCAQHAASSLRTALLTEHGRLDALDDLDASLRRTSVATPNGIRADCPFIL
jgi:hypothetical protein